jgi:hypothetical protein
MEQGYKDFLISGTKDKTLIRLLEDDIVNDTGIFMFVANAKETIKKHIEEFKNTISNSNLGTIEAWDKKYSVPDCFKKTLLTSTDYIASCNVNATEVYGDFNNMPAAPSAKESPLMVVAQISSLVEICNFKDLTFDIHSEARFSEFSNFKLMVDVISHIIKEIKNDKKDKPNSLIKSKASDNNLVGRYIVERIDCNNFYGMLQVRFVSRHKRVVYNHYFLKDKDHKQSLQSMDEKYKLGVIKNNNFTISAIYKHSRHTNISGILFDTIEEQEQLNLSTISNRNMYLLSKVCNRNFKLITSLKNSLRAYCASNNKLDINSSIKISSSLMLSSVVFNSLKRKEAENLITTTMIAGISLEAELFNTEISISNTADEISEKRILDTAKLVLKNVPTADKTLDEYKSDIERVFAEYITKEKRNLNVFKDHYKKQQDNDMLNKLNNFLTSVRDTINKSMFDDMLWLNYQGPKKLDDKITILSALNSIVINGKFNNVIVNILGNEEMFVDDIFIALETSRRESALIAKILTNSLNIELRKFINNIKIKTISRIDSKLEETINNLNNLKAEELITVTDEYAIDAMKIKG